MADDEATEPDTGTPDDILEEAKEAYKLAEERESENREEALKDLKFARLGEQWPDAIKKQRETDGRPCLTFNLLPPFIRQVVNDARQNRPAIKVHPADSYADPETAEILNGLIRNIEATSKADQAYDTAIDFAVSMGFGYYRINTKYACDDTFDLDISIDRIANPFSVLGDPYATEADSSGWNSAFVAEAVTKDAFERLYKGAQPVNWSEDYAGLPAPWAQGDDEVMVTEWWTRERTTTTIVLLSDGEVIEADVFEANRDFILAAGIQVAGERQVESYKVRQRLLTGAEVLEDKPWPGKFIPIIPVYGDEVNIEGKRVFRSLIRDAHDAQRNHNYWRTAATELAALAPRVPFIGVTGQFKTDAKKWQTANSVSHAYIEYDPVNGAQAPQRQTMSDVPAAAIQEAATSADELKAIIGIYDAGLGQQDNAISGKAILGRQRESDNATFHFIDNLSRSIEHGGRVVLDLIPHVYSGQRIVRVLGPKGERQPGVQLAQHGQPAPMIQGPRPGAQPQPNGSYDPADIIKVYDLTAGKYDLTVEVGPSFGTRREEAAAQMISVIMANPELAPQLLPIAAKNLDWPGADEIAEAMAGADPRVQQLTQQLQQLQGQAAAMAQDSKDQMSAAMAQIEQLQVALSKEKSRTQIELAKLVVDRFSAETDRLKAVAPKGLNVEADPVVLAGLVQQIMAQLGTSTDIDAGSGPMPAPIMARPPMNGQAPPFAG